MLSLKESLFPPERHSLGGRVLGAEAVGNDVVGPAVDGILLTINMSYGIDGAVVAGQLAGSED